MTITDKILFTSTLLTAPTYVNMRPIVDIVCFQRTKVFYDFEEEF